MKITDLAGAKIHRTYLEMKTKPSFAAPEFDSGVQILRAEKPTVAFYRYLYNTVGEPWYWVDRRRMADGDLKNIIENPAVHIHVLYKGGVPAGYVELNQTKPDEVELAYFGLMPEFVGGGLGKLFLQWSVLKAWSLPIRRLWLHTCTLDHPAALPLYRKIGFEEFDAEDYEFK